MKGLSTEPDDVGASVLVKTVFKVLSGNMLGHSSLDRQGWMNSGMTGLTRGVALGRGQDTAWPNLSTIVSLVIAITHMSKMAWFGYFNPT